jgi:hypothetical protein
MMFNDFIVIGYYLVYSPCSRCVPRLQHPHNDIMSDHLQSPQHPTHHSILFVDVYYLFYDDARYPRPSSSHMQSVARIKRESQNFSFRDQGELMFHPPSSLRFSKEICHQIWPKTTGTHYVTHTLRSTTLSHDDRYWVSHELYFPRRGDRTRRCRKIS